MKRDMDLVREILLLLEVSTDVTGSTEIEISGHSHDELHYHLKIMEESGLIEAVDASSMGGIEYFPRGLTWYGHEFLDAARDKDRWERAKTLVGNASFEILKGALVKLALKAVT